MTRSNTRLAIIVLLITAAAALRAPAESARAGIYRHENLVAWCIVPYDGMKRGPEERAAMMEKLGIKRFAYDWRAEHLPTFEQEIAALQKHGIELTAVWFPGSLNKDARFILDALAAHKLRSQLWVSAHGNPPNDATDEQKLDAGVAAIRPIAEEAAKIGCPVGLYNHGGAYGEPEMMLAVVRKLNLPNVGIVYNLHHGHDHVGRFAQVLAQMKPHLLAVNLNGMTAGGDKVGKKILPLGQGELDLQLLKTLRDSGYTGYVGILNHTSEDAELRLMDNLEGLDWLVRQLDGNPTGPRPQPRSYHPQASQPAAAG